MSHIEMNAGSRFFRDGRDPSLPANHPINALSAWRKFGILATLSFCGFLANYSVAAIQVAFVPMGEAFGVSPGLIPDSIGYNLLGLAVGPLFWNPLSKTIGRRPTYLLGSAIFIPMVIWMALSKTYTVFCVGRAIAGLSSAWSQTVPPSTIGDIFVKEVRGSKMSMFGVAVIIAPAVAPIICGLVVNSHSWTILFWIVLGLAGLQFLLIFFLVPETLWIEDSSEVMGEVPSPQTASIAMASTGSGTHIESEQKLQQEMVENVEQAHGTVFKHGHVGAAWMPWQRPGEFLKVFLSPIIMLQYITITIPSIYYGSIFAWSVGITIVMPQKFVEPPYDFSTIALGCAFAAFGIGGVLGKWSGGIVGDRVVGYFERRNGGIRQPEYRLWAMFPLFPFMFGGLVIVGVTIKKELHWIAYLMGGALFFYCLSAATGLLQTYVMEGYISRSMDTQAVFVFWKAMWGFAIAFFVYNWGLDHGFLEEYIIQGVLVTAVGVLLCSVLIWKGYEIRKWQGMPV